jgi:hypothetical protein
LSALKQNRRGIVQVVEIVQNNLEWRFIGRGVFQGLLCPCTETIAMLSSYVSIKKQHVWMFI